MSKKIIIVEDEPLLLKALNIQLLSCGYEVLSAVDGEAAINLIQEQKPDLVLLDLLLPKLSGFEVLRLAKEDKTIKDIPIIILSNLGQKEEVKRGLELGATDYFIKANTDLSQISEKIEGILKIKA